MVNGAGLGAARDGRGRFVPGQSGNPAGKLPGTRNRAALLRAALDSAEGPALARVVIDKALGGDVVTARFCLDRLEPRPRGRTIEIDLPEGARVSDVVAAFDATLRAMATGEITPDEAVQVTRVLDGRRKAIEAAWAESARDERRSAMEPSPSGRGQGEGAVREFEAVGRASWGGPHPDPLPEGEGTMMADPPEKITIGASVAPASSLSPDQRSGWRQRFLRNRESRHAGQRPTLPQASLRIHQPRHTFSQRGARQVRWLSLPEGEGIAVAGKGSPGRGKFGAFAADLLHSTCISSQSPVLPGAILAAVAGSATGAPSRSDSGLSRRGGF